MLDSGIETHRLFPFGNSTLISHCSPVVPLQPANEKIKVLDMRQMFTWMREHPGWQKNPDVVSRGVTWDARCQLCGLTIENGEMLPKGIIKEGKHQICQRVTLNRLINPTLCNTCAPITQDDN